MKHGDYLIRRVLDWGVVLISLGVMGILVSAFADSIGFGRPGFGLEQLSGVAIGVLVTMVGLVKVLFSCRRMLVRVLAGIYVIGILYVGLRPSPLRFIHYKTLLEVSSFYWRDFAINTMGFIPLGYLLMLSFGIRTIDHRYGSLIKKAIVVTGAGGLISLFLEVSQYYLIPGRSSSLIDLIANILGTLIGIALYIFIEAEWVLGAPFLSPHMGKEGG